MESHSMTCESNSRHYYRNAAPQVTLNLKHGLTILKFRFQKWRIIDGSCVRIAGPLRIYIALNCHKQTLSTFEDVTAETDLDNLSSEARRILEAVKRQDKVIGLDEKPGAKRPY